MKFPPLQIVNRPDSSKRFITHEMAGGCVVLEEIDPYAIKKTTSQSFCIERKNIKPLIKWLESLEEYHESN